MAITILCVVGTRPDAIKMAPIIRRLRNESWADVRVLATAQHRQMLDEVLDFFQIVPDVDLDAMTHNQQLASLTAKILQRSESLLQTIKPSVVLVQGDTVTAMAVAMASFFAQIPIGHVEAGLRTGNLSHPFPEEANRVIISKLASWHFAPTRGAETNLLADGIAQDAIHVTGNSVIDALLWTAAQKVELGLEIPDEQRLVLVTVHRRESFGQPLQNICQALKTLAERNPKATFLFPTHPNPNVHTVVHQKLGGIDNVVLCEPLDYSRFVAAMKRANLIISDSGGVQEEAPALGTPVVVLRETTERPEGVDLAAIKVVGTDTERIVRQAQKYLDSPVDSESIKAFPYGDGHTAEMITSILKKEFVQ